MSKNFFEDVDFEFTDEDDITEETVEELSIGFAEDGDDEDVDWDAEEVEDDE